MQIAIFPSSGIGDGLIFLTLAYNLHKVGHQVHIYHEALLGMRNLFPTYQFFSSWDISKLQNYDQIICQNDNSEKTKSLISKKRDVLSIFYPTYKKEKHGPLQTDDTTFNCTLSMVDNILIACEKVFNIPTPEKQTGIDNLKGIYRKYPNRVVIHPTSKDRKKNWPKAKYLKLASSLKKKGFEVVFMLSPYERNEFKELKSPYFTNLEQASNYMYESGYFIGNDSGLGHLASLLNIPLITIGNNKKNLDLWRPGYRKGILVTPSKFIPNIKGLKIRQNKWAHFISPRKILKIFHKQEI